MDDPLSSEDLHSDFEEPGPETRDPRRRYPWAMLVVAIVFILVAFMSWYGTWFGRSLSDKELSEYLDDREKPRHEQQALEQIVQRIMNHDRTVSRYYPQIASLASSPAPQVRAAAAWTMQYDATFDGFHKALLLLLSDNSPNVRHQAALSLVTFGDAAGRTEIVSMLQPYTIKSAAAGVVKVLISEGDAFRAGSPIIRIDAAGHSLDVAAPDSGRLDHVLVSNGARVLEGQDVAVLSPSAEQVWEGLRALYLIGQPEDLPAVQKYATSLPGLSDRVRQQAASTADAIHQRQSSK